MGILPKHLQKILRMNDSKFMDEIMILQEQQIVDYGEDDIAEKTASFIIISGQDLNMLFICNDKGIPIRKLLSTMDFTARMYRRQNRQRRIRRSEATIAAVEDTMYCLSICAEMGMYYYTIHEES
jgi:hypothetical protein